MRVWLAISGTLFLIWTAVLVAAPQLLLSPQQVAGHAGAVLAVALVKLWLGALAWWSAGNPGARRLGVYTTIVTLLVTWVVDMYGVLVALPPQQAALTLADLLLCVALVVGCLEALPRTLGIQSPV